jgi:hypothetical protein
MKKVVLAVFVVLVAVSMSVGQDCATIKSGTITDVNNKVITTGFDKYGYNYQAHMFNGLAVNFSRPPVPETEGAENLTMKWADNWLANVDCNHDGKLDRGLDVKTGTLAGISKGWVTNHYEGDYEDGGVLYHYTYFAKIVYDGGEACSIPSNDSCLWGSYTIIEEVYNDPHGTRAHGNDRSKLVKPAGLGQY